jgi:8-oxo-dGTP pyrophosphatase MutT (NUDIX family)
MIEPMRIVGVLAPGVGTSVDVTLGHGEDPRMLLWREGWVLTRMLSTHMDEQGIVLTVQVRTRSQSSRPPRIKSRGLDPQLKVGPDEVAVPHQRVAAYAIVRSRRGVLGTQCSDRTAIPGLWQLPGGGLEVGETPSEGVVREIMEETGQRVRINRLIDVQSDHWVGRAPTGVLEDFQALRIIYTAVCDDPTHPQVLDIGGTTMSASWVSLRHWRSLQWTSGARSLLDRHLTSV